MDRGRFWAQFAVDLWPVGGSEDIVSCEMHIECNYSAVGHRFTSGKRSFQGNSTYSIKSVFSVSKEESFVGQLEVHYQEVQTHLEPR